MEKIAYKKGLCRGLTPSVFALGFFDGVHIGHRALLERAKGVAKELGLCFSVFTFSSESEGLKPREGRIYSTDEKCEIFESLGVERAVIASFEEISEISAEDFVRDVLSSELSCKIAVTGEDFRFGKGALGDTNALRRLMNETGGSAIAVCDERVGGEKISTTMIKELLSRGDARRAMKLLGEAYHVDSRVERGRGVGRTLGIPTINNSLPKNADFIAAGVYLSRVKIGGKFYTGLTNIGVCPTFEKRPPHAETFILNFSGEIYGDRVRIYLIEKIRDERRFPNESELVAEIEQNVRYAREADAKLSCDTLI